MSAKPSVPFTSWESKRASLRHHMDTEPWETFLRWSTVEATMWVGEAWYIDEEYAALPPRWKAVLHPEGFGARNIPRYATSGNLIHQAYHLALWEKVTGQQVDSLASIVEIGGGYGAAAKLVLARGFTGKYYAYDFPDVLELQQYYLARPANFIPCPLPQALPERPDLLLSFYAFSELPLLLRASLLACLQPHAWAFAYQNSFDRLDNLEYFTTLILTNPDYKWQTLPSPGFINHHYLFGSQ